MVAQNWSNVYLCVLPIDALIGVGGAIFETLSRFVNSVDNDDSAAAAAAAAAPTTDVCEVIVLLLLFVELPLAGIRNLMLGDGTIFEPCTRFTCRIIPSGAII